MRLRGTIIVIVGLPDAAVKESGDRVTAALTNSGFKFPMGRSTINPATADVGEIDKAYEDEADLAEVKGEDSIERALETASAGGHNAPILSPISRRQKTNQTMS